MPTTPLTPESIPLSERVRQYKYRFAQSLVFGLPVIALEVWGRALGGREADRWVLFLQALLAGWIMYVGAAGMLVGGLLMLPKLTPDLVVAATAIASYLIALASFLIPSLRPLSLFTCAVLLVTAWSGLQWWRLHSSTADTPPGDRSPPPGSSPQTPSA
jgi:preprotein translocase subunit Sec61beta